MYVMAISTITERDKFWSSLKKAYGKLPKGARWTLAVGSADGTRAVNILVHESQDSIRGFFDEHVGAFGKTEYFEADGDNAVGLQKR